MISALWSIDRSVGRSTKGTASRWLLKSRLGRRKHEIVVWGGHGREHVKGEVHSKTALGRSFACLPHGSRTCGRRARPDQFDLSATDYPGRIDTCTKSILSIWCQTIQCGKFIYLALAKFPPASNAGEFIQTLSEPL